MTALDGPTLQALANLATAGITWTSCTTQLKEEI